MGSDVDAPFRKSWYCAVTSLVEHLLSRRWLAEAGSVWRSTVPCAAKEHEVPDNSRELIEGQLRLVAPAKRDVLEVASVAGLAFDGPAVAARRCAQSQAPRPRLNRSSSRRRTRRLACAVARVRGVL